MKLRIQKWLDEVNYTQFVKVCSVTKVALGQDELVTCKGHGYPHHVIIMIIIIIIFLLLLLIIIITITTRWAVVPLWLGLSLPTVESAFSQGLRAILILKRSSPKPNPKSKPWYQNIARIAKAALHKLPGKSSQQPFYGKRSQYVQCAVKPKFYWEDSRWLGQAAQQQPWGGTTPSFWREGGRNKGGPMLSATFLAVHSWGGGTSSSIRTFL